MISTPSSVCPGVSAWTSSHSDAPAASDEEPLDDIPEEDMLADPLYRARISHGGYNGVVEHIEQGAVTKERLYRILYDDGDTEHITSQEAARGYSYFLSAATCS